jgi:hypothetical protein
VAPTNPNLQRVLLLITGALLPMFDGPVTVDADHPPTTRSFNHSTSIQPGPLNFGTSTYLILNGFADNGSPVVIAANDPGAGRRAVVSNL